MNPTKEILIITPHAVHDKIGHAGGKTLNFYVSQFVKDAAFKVNIAYLGDLNNNYQLMVKQYPLVGFFSDFKKKAKLKKVFDGFRFRIIYPFLKHILPKYYVTNNFNKARIKNVLGKASKINFDIIIAEFADPIYWIDEIRHLFPDSFLIASCHDVTYLAVERVFLSAEKKNIFNKAYYNKFKNNELKCLNKFDLVVVHNIKDKQLLENEKAYNNPNTHVISPYYDTYQLSLDKSKKTVVFFGAMNRADNQNAVEWFLNNVWHQINEHCRRGNKFIIVGGGLPLSKQEKYISHNNVEITGFVENPDAIFSTAFCFVVPLQGGGGIKVKVIEAMAAGIPVVTNNIGIEGIPGINGFNYLHAETADDFFDCIIKLKDNKILWQEIANNAKNTISSNFNLAESYQAYKGKILSGLFAKIE